jgi:hypothetical protein
LGEYDGSRLRERGNSSPRLGPFPLGLDGPRATGSRALKEATQKAVDGEVAKIERAVRAVRCTEHGESAKVRRAKTHDGVKLQVEGCCDDLVERAEKVLAEATR